MREVSQRSPAGHMWPVENLQVCAGESWGGGGGSLESPGPLGSGLCSASRHLSDAPCKMGRIPRPDPSSAAALRGDIQNPAKTRVVLASRLLPPTVSMRDRLPGSEAVEEVQPVLPPTPKTLSANPPRAKAQPLHQGREERRLTGCWSLAAQITSP